MDSSKPDILDNESEGSLLIRYEESSFLREIKIKYDEEHNTEGNEFKITADSKGDTVIVYGPGVYDKKITPVIVNKGPDCDKAESSFISIGQPRVFPLKIKVKNTSEMNVNIVTPIGEKLPGFVKTLPNGQLGVRFTPRDVGNHIINLNHPSSFFKNPLIIVVTEKDILDCSKIQIIGDKLERCYANTENFCTIDCKAAGNDSLSILVEGIGKCAMNYVDQDDGTYVLKYTFSTPGDYTLSLRFGDENIPGSPFVMKVEPKEDSSEIPELPEADCPPLKKMRLETERDQKNYHLSYSRIIKLERENSFLRSENANLARLLKLSEDPEISKNESNIVFILDTNMLIHKLALVDKLKDSFIEGCPVVICLPYIVIQELDHLKFKQKNRNETRIAIHYVNEILQKHASYYSQSINQAKIAETLFGLTGDDKVLECCLGLSKQFKNVFLLTKDVNLANVAQFWGVKTYEIKRLEAFLKPGKNFGFKEIRKEKKKLFGQTSEEVDNSDDDSSSNPLDSSLTTSDDYSSE